VVLRRHLICKAASLKINKGLNCIVSSQIDLAFPSMDLSIVSILFLKSIQILVHFIDFVFDNINWYLVIAFILILLTQTMPSFFMRFFKRFGLKVVFRRLSDLVLLKLKLLFQPLNLLLIVFFTSLFTFH
jgi:hypothetical protein